MEPSKNLQKIEKLTRRNIGIFLRLYPLRAAAQGWDDILLDDAAGPRGDESEEHHQQRCGAAIYDLLSSISHGLLPEVAPTGATLNQVWVSMNQLNTQSSALRAHAIRKQLYPTFTRPS